jgi:tetratricopeptide (TPR) repeat protein
MGRGELELAQVRGEQRLFLNRQRRDALGTARSLSMLGSLAAERGDFERGAAMAQEAVEICRSHPDARSSLATALHNLGVIRERRGDATQAEVAFTEALALDRAHGDLDGLSGNTISLGATALMAGNDEKAYAMLREGLRLARAAEVAEYWAPTALGMLAELEARRGAWGRAARLLAVVECQTELSGEVLEGQHRERFEKIRAMVRAQLPASDLLAEWGRGRSLTLDEAVEYALSSID